MRTRVAVSLVASAAVFLATLCILEHEIVSHEPQSLESLDFLGRLRAGLREGYRQYFNAENEYFWTGPPESDDFVRTVLIMRHCVKNQNLTEKYEIYDNLQAFSQYPFPDLLPQGHDQNRQECTPRGEEIMYVEGQVLRQAGLPTPVRMVADGMVRDWTSGERLLQGLDVEANGIYYDRDHVIFYPSAAGICDHPSENEVNKEVWQRLNEDLNEKLELLQNLLGENVAPPLISIPDGVQGGRVVGGVAIAAKLAAKMQMQYGSGFPIPVRPRVDTVTPLQMSPEQMYDFLSLEAYFRQVSVRTKWVVRGMSNLLAHVLDDLIKPETGSVVYLGHDTQLDGIAEIFDFDWTIPPYPDNFTPPGSAIALTVTGGPGRAPMVTAKLIYTTLGDEAGLLREAEARFTAEWGGGRNQVPYDLFRRVAENYIDHECVTGKLA